MILLGSGSGGVEEMKSAIKWDDACFGVLRRTFLYDDTHAGMGPTNVTKFIFVACRPDNLALKRKSKLSIYEATIKKLFSPYHMDLEVSNETEIGEKIIEDLIARVTMKADKDGTGKPVASFLMGGMAVNARTAQSDAHSAKKQADTEAVSFAGSAGGANVNFDDLDNAKSSIADVRNDQTDTTWCLFGYKDTKTIQQIGKGNGNVPEEMLSTCPEKTICYGFFRIEEQLERSKAIRFVFVTLIPENIPVMQRAAVSTHKNAVLPVFRPYHADFNISKSDEINYEIVMNHLNTLSGTKSMVTDRKPQQKEEKYERKVLGGLTNEKISIEVQDLSTIQESIKEVRNDSSNIEWCIAGTIEKGKEAVLAYVDKGSDLESFKSKIHDPQRVMFGLIRRTHKIDATTAIKFVFVTYQGESIPAWLKAKMGTYRGSVVDIFHPYHAEMFVDNINELTDDTIQKRIGDKN